MRTPVKNVLLTYAPADQTAAREASASLEPAGFAVSDPEIEMLPGDGWTPALKLDLDSTDAMVVLLSPDIKQSRGLFHQIEYALSAERFSERLIPVMVRKTKDYPWIPGRFPKVRNQTSREAGKAVADLMSKPIDAPQKRRAG
jgi:hypothetical protein